MVFTPDDKAFHLDYSCIQIRGADDIQTAALVERLVLEDFLGQLVTRSGRAADLARERGIPQLDWVDGIENALSRRDLLAMVEEEAGSALRAGIRHIIWSGMGGSVQTVHTLKRLGYLDIGSVSVHPLDSTDPAALNRILREVAEREGVSLAGGSTVEPKNALRKALESTLMVAVAMGMTSEEPITHLRWFWDLVNRLEIARPQDRIQVIALEGSFLDQYARERGIRSFPLQMEGVCRTPGRMSAPATRVFLRPAAWVLAARALAQRPNVPFDGTLLANLLGRAQALYRVGHALSPQQRAQVTREDAFIRLGAYIAKEEAGGGRNKVLLSLAPRWQWLAPWIEQVVEESLGKGGAGFLIFYDQRIEKLASGHDRIILRIGIGDDLPPAMARGVDGDTPVVSLQVPVAAVSHCPTALAETATVFAGFEKTVAAFAYLRNIVFAGQPAVEAYKRYARGLRDGVGDIAGTRSSQWRLRDGDVTVDFSALMAAGLLSPEELAFGVPDWRRGSAGALLARLLRLAISKDRLGYLDLTFNGELAPPLQSVFDRAKRLIANGMLGVPAKVRVGPSDYHSTEQGETDGPPEMMSLRFVCLEHEPIVAGEYDDRFLLAQAYGTWQAMEEAGRWIVMVIIERRDELASTLERLFAEVATSLSE